MRTLICFCSALSLAVACGDSDPAHSNNSGMGGAGLGPVGGTAGVSGVGGAGAGGMAGVMMGGGVEAAVVPDCTAVAPGTYADVNAIFGGPDIMGIGSCAASSCHGTTTGGQPGRGDLNFKTVMTDITEVLVNVPACEASSMMRVVPGDPDNSWLWVKMTAPIMDTDGGQIIHTATPTDCSGVTPGTLGTRMPQVLGFFTPLDNEPLCKIKTWIEAGAPGP